MGLFSFGKKKASPKKKNTNSFGEDMNRLTKDGELPYGWVYANRNFTEKIEKEYHTFSEAYFNTNRNDLLERYAALKSLILYMEDAKKLCESKGECFAMWATFEVADPAAIKLRKAELKELEAKLKKKA